MLNIGKPPSYVFSSNIKKFYYFNYNICPHAWKIRSIPHLTFGFFRIKYRFHEIKFPNRGTRTYRNLPVCQALSVVKYT